MSHAGIIFDADSELKPDFRGFDFLLFPGIKSETNKFWIMNFEVKLWPETLIGEN